jgi:hypothetical protein
MSNPNRGQCIKVEVRGVKLKVFKLWGVVSNRVEVHVSFVKFPIFL